MSENGKVEPFQELVDDLGSAIRQLPEVLGRALVAPPSEPSMQQSSVRSMADPDRQAALMPAPAAPVAPAAEFGGYRTAAAPASDSPLSGPAATPSRETGALFESASAPGGGQSNRVLDEIRDLLQDLVDESKSEKRAPHGSESKSKDSGGPLNWRMFHG